MKRLKPILDTNRFTSELIINENKILLSRLNSYTKIEFLLELTKFMKEQKIEYIIDPDLNVTILPIK